VYIYISVLNILVAETRARHCEAQKSSGEFGALSSWIHLVRP